MILRLEEEKREILSRLVCTGMRGSQWETLSRKVTIELNILSDGNLHDIEKGRDMSGLLALLQNVKINIDYLQ